MSVNTTATLKLELSYVQFDANSSSLTKTSDIGSISSVTNLTAQSGDSSLNTLWYDSITLPSGGSYPLNLQSLTKTLFCKDTTINFTKLRALIVKNTSLNAGADILIEVSGSDGLTGIFNSGTGQYRVYPSSAGFFTNPIQGWVINSSHRAIILKDIGGSGVTVDVSFIGVSS